MALGASKEGRGEGRLWTASLSCWSQIRDFPPLTTGFSSESAPDAETLLRNAAAQTVPLVTLKRGCAFFVERGNNLIFVDSIHSLTGRQAELGDEVVVCDPSRKIIGWGIYNPLSVYRVRMLQSLMECQEDIESVFDVKRVFATRLEAAVKLRSSIGLPSSSTNAYRLVNSDGDHLSGVVVDRFGDVAVVHSGVSWLEIHREEIVEILKTTLKTDTVVWRLRPVVRDQEGMPHATEGIYTSRSDREMKGEVEIVENGVRYWMALSGQKTGFYSDQRENRAFVRDIAEGKSVLDLCCYTGGFSLNAANGGAKTVLGIDSSQPAIDLAKRNSRLNDLDAQCRFVCGDILNQLQVALLNGESWDMVILDPPKLAFSKLQMSKSLGRYRKLNKAAMKVVKSGGLIVTCSCSGTIDLDRFIKVVWEAAEQIGRRLTILRESGAAPDHVHDLSHPEGNYLKCLVARVL